MTGRGRPRSFNRDEALQKAMDLFWEKGYAGTSLADLTAAMGIGAPSLYGTFGSKEELFRQALDRYKAHEGGATASALLAGATVRAGIENMLLAAVASGTQPGRPRGCMVVLSAPAGAEDQLPVRQLLCEDRQRMQGLILKRLKQAVRQGELPRHAALPALAAYFATVLNGLAIEARDGVARDTLEQTARLAMLTWDALAGSAA
ncbi:TetR/AcrR family transcriptional regulator [Bordetella genomosp. 7]|uniref:TetR family transcriptional regulator n=1 Tax=Bordetella genomosp. 7 TaxID=1416805 RepID=A0A261RHD3_9BORD|nr:TetR/AcrR family transcriptional regulator [Bordetella genomosp. 7]OZI24444.1 TetR family transcriptional regulator [Bordetella genomosp. 7]